MANKNIYEVFDDFNKAKNKSERIDVLRNGDSWALRQVLIGCFNPSITFSVKKLPEFKREDVPPGMSYGHMTEALSRVYLFQEGNPRVPPALTEKRKEEILIQILESLEPPEADVFGNMLLKNLKVKYLTEGLVNEAFAGLLPQS